MAVPVLTPAAWAQETSELITQSLPQPAYIPVGTDHYRHKIGPVGLSYGLLQELIFTDNVNYLSVNPEADFAVSTRVNLGLFYRVSQYQALQLDFGIGYQYWMNTERGDPFQLTIAPNSQINYRLKVGAVELAVSNDTQSTSQASSRSDFTGGGTTAGYVEFNRLLNRSMLTAVWEASRRMTVSGSGSFVLERSLNDQFGTLDRDLYQAQASAMYLVTAPLSAGLTAGYTIFDHVESVQNDGSSLSVGPRVQWRISRSLSVGATVGYTTTQFDRSGTIADTSEFAGVTWSAEVRHTLNRRVQHSLVVARSVDSGFGSNFTDEFSVIYNAQARVGEKLNPFLNASYRQANQSGRLGLTGDLYSVGTGVGYPVYRRLHVGLAYTYNLRVGETDLTSYTENRVTLSAMFHF